MGSERGLPSWEDASYGTMKRAALWLVTVIGVGEVFTKEQLRDAFPGVSQVDRRMRDLREYGWKIDTNREDPTLEPYEQRFVVRGADVWVPGKAVKVDADALSTKSLSTKRRREIMAKDGHFCRSCGIAQGETYAGSFETAQLDIARREVVQPDGSASVQLVTECNRCRVGGRTLTADLDKVLAGIRSLGRLEKRILAGWVADDHREFNAIEQLWADYRSLPEESRAEVRAALEPGS